MGDNYYHNFNKLEHKPREINPLQAGFFLTLLTIVAVCVIVMLCGCQSSADIAKVPELPVSVEPAVQGNANALERANAAIKTIPAKADAASLAAPVIKPQAEAIKVAANAAGAAVADAKTQSAAVALGIDDRDRVIAIQVDALKKETDRAESAEKSLKDRAKNRIEWILTIGGFAIIAVALGVAYMLFQAGSVVRAIGVVATGLVVGSACFAAAVYFDIILTIGAWTLGGSAAIGLVVLVLHYRKHLNKAKTATAN